MKSSLQRIFSYLKPTVWISVFTSVGCFGGSRVARSVLELLRKPGGVARKADCKCTLVCTCSCLETMYAASGKIAPFVRLGWLAPAKRVAGSSVLTVTPNSSTFLCSLLFDKIMSFMLERARYNNYFLFQH